jgi:hypothetical protein
MKKLFISIICAVSCLVIAGISNPAFAGSEQFDEKMQPILAEYLKMADKLASDKTDGVADAAKKIEGLAGSVSSSLVTGEHASHYKSIPGSISDGAKKMLLAKEIAGMRSAFVSLSKPVVMWVAMSKPSGINVVYCQGDPGSWLQKGAVIRNPYNGSKKLACGEIISGPDAKSK